EPVVDRGPPGRLVQRDPDASGQAIHMAEADAAEGFAKIPHEPVHEEGAVAALQGQLMVVRDDVMKGTVPFSKCNIRHNCATTCWRKGDCPPSAYVNAPAIPGSARSPSPPCSLSRPR